MNIEGEKYHYLSSEIGYRVHKYWILHVYCDKVPASPTGAVTQLGLTPLQPPASPGSPGSQVNINTARGNTVQE